MYSVRCTVHVDRHIMTTMASKPKRTRTIFFMMTHLDIALINLKRQAGAKWKPTDPSSPHGVALLRNQHGGRHAKLVGVKKQQLTTSGRFVGIDNDLFSTSQRLPHTIPAQAKIRQSTQQQD